jgi:hypothetical protein
MLVVPNEKTLQDVPGKRPHPPPSGGGYKRSGLASLTLVAAFVGFWL